MTMKTTALAATLAFVCSVGVAAAQTPNPSPSGGPNPDEARALLQDLATKRNVTAATAGQPQNLAMSTNLISGWNFFHATNCGWLVDGLGNQWFYVLPLEGGIIVAINNLYASQGLQISCSDGNVFGIFVINPVTGAYTQAQSFTFR